MNRNDDKKCKTVTLYKWTYLQAVPGWHDRHGFSLTYRDVYGAYKCDLGLDYKLPAGYAVAESISGEMLIYDEKENPCDIHYHGGTPVLSSLTREIELEAAHVIKNPKAKKVQ